MMRISIVLRREWMYVRFSPAVVLPDVLARPGCSRGTHVYLKLQEPPETGSVMMASDDCIFM
jgi:hypothetical protein